MIEWLRAGVLIRFQALIDVVARAARVRAGGSSALCVLDLGDAKALRFALAVHQAHPAGPDPAQLVTERPRARGPCLARSAAVELVATVAAEVLGEAIAAEVRAVHRAGAVPVVVVGEALALVASLDAPARGAVP